MRLAPPILPWPYSGAFGEGPIGFFSEVRFDGSPLVAYTYMPRPEYTTTQMELDAGFEFGIFDFGLEVDRDTYDGMFRLPEMREDASGFSGVQRRVAGRVRADVHEDRLWGEIEFESRTQDVDFGEAFYVGYEIPDAFEMIVRGEMALWWDSWSLLGDLRWVSYSDAEWATVVTDTLGVESTVYERQDGTERFFTPYLALVYSPRPNLELRAGVGVDPMSYVDAPYEGRANGRERFRTAYLWDHSGHALHERLYASEEALEDALKTLSLMGVIRF
jgi:hypothetical protein